MKSNTSNILKYLLVLLPMLSVSCTDDGLTPEKNNMQFPEQLSSHNIFQGNLANLVPAPDFELYELQTELFTDYAEKQRLVKIPSGKSMKVQGDGLPSFPDGTVLVKTFYYYNDRRDPAKGKRVLETRLEILNQGKWNVGVYLWNEAQTDGTLLKAGINRNVNWIDAQGKAQVVSYHVPSQRECSTCHSKSDNIVPIGPKLRNLNREVMRNGSSVNQLSHFASKNIIDQFNPAAITRLPDWKDVSLSIESRARAYMDVNCAHCHSDGGYAARQRLMLSYEEDLSETGIKARKQALIGRMEKGQMPFIGTTIVHEEGLELVKEFLKTL